MHTLMRGFTIYAHEGGSVYLNANFELMILNHFKVCFSNLPLWINGRMVYWRSGSREQTLGWI